MQQYHRGAGIKLWKHEVHDTELKLEDVAPQSDIIITGVPAAGYKFPSKLIRDGAICVNFSSEILLGSKNMLPFTSQRSGRL